MSDLRRWINPYRAKLSEYSDKIFEISGDDSPQLGVIAELLDSADEVFCEIGSGSGNHLVELGKRNPQARVFGFEIRYKRSVRTIEKAAAAGVDNVFVFRMPAEEIERIFPPASLDRVYVNFPDPWAKRKQWKHRVLRKSFLDSIHSLLNPEGYVSVKTDHDEYFSWFQDILHADSRFRCLAETKDYYSSTFFVDNIETEFELLFKHKGQHINFLTFSHASSEDSVSG